MFRIKLEENFLKKKIFFLTEKKKADGEKTSKKKKVTNGCPFYMYQQLQKFRDHLLVRSLQIINSWEKISN